jgi:hypothetical protein
MTTIYRKTAKGQREIETRALKLAPRFRNLLILVDGRRSDAELIRLTPRAGATGLEALAQGGFIKAVVQSVDVELALDPVETDGPAPVQSAAQSPADPVAAAGGKPRRGAAAEALTQLVGPAGEPLAKRIRGARTASELARLIDSAAQLVAETRGQAAATAFAQRFTAL